MKKLQEELTQVQYQLNQANASLASSTTENSTLRSDNSQLEDKLRSVKADFEKKLSEARDEIALSAQAAQKDTQNMNEK